MFLLFGLFVRWGLGDIYSQSVGLVAKASFKVGVGKEVFLVLGEVLLHFEGM